jgi:hypothetical protein
MDRIKVRLFCPKCGAQNDDNATFCASCGNNLKADTPQPPMGSPGSPGQPGAQMGGPSKFDIKGTFMDAIALVKNPKAFMTARADTAPPVMTTITKYVAILAIIPFLFTLLGDAIFQRAGHHIVYAVIAGIVAYIFAVVSVVVVGFILWKLAPRFLSVSEQNKATKLVSYIYTPVFLIAVLNIIPALAIVNILALLYGLYILYIGLPIVLKTPQNKVVMYVIATLVVTFIVYFILALIGAGLSSL